MNRENNKQGYNILIVGMSTFPRTVSKCKFYEPDNNNEIEYYSQIEPITRMIIHKNIKIDEVIILCTKDVKEKKKLDIEELYIKEEEYSEIEFYKKRIKDTENVELKCVEFPKNGIDINLDNAKNDKREAVSEVANYVLKKKREKGKINLWIDTQGGPRDIIFLLNAICSLLKIADINPNGVYALNNIDIANRVWKIDDQTQIYKIFDFVSGMNEFIVSGRANQLEEYYLSIGKNIPKIVEIMKNLADAILICDVRGFDKYIDELRQQINDIEENKSSKENDIDELLLTFIEYIKSDYADILENTNDIYAKIDWLWRKKFYQQTLTYIESNVPQYWAKEEVDILRFVRIDNNVENKMSKKDLYPNVINTYVNEIMNCNYLKKDVKKKIVENDCAKYIKIDDYAKYIKVDDFELEFKYKRNEKNIINVRTKIKDTIKNDDGFKNEIVLYKILKDQRNCYNHMKDDTLDIGTIGKYVKDFCVNGKEIIKNNR